MNFVAKINFGDESIQLNLDGRWHPSSEEVGSLAKVANVLSKPPFYEYSPSHGSYGPLLASNVVKKIGGEVELPPSDGGQEPDPDVVY